MSETSGSVKVIVLRQEGPAMAVEIQSALPGDDDKELNPDVRRALKRQLDGIVEPLAPWVQDNPSPCHDLDDQDR